jgi:ATP-dependent RNA helicase DDX20
MDMDTEIKHNGNDAKRRTMDVSVSDEFTFKKFMLSERLLKTLEKLNYNKPSPIQLKILPLCRCTFDMIIQAKSGTGKTLGFSICLLENFDTILKFPSILVIVPTRELAVQIVNVLNDLGQGVKHFKAESFIGGTDLSKDRAKMQSTKAVVGTPGR